MYMVEGFKQYGSKEVRRQKSEISLIKRNYHKQHYHYAKGLCKHRLSFPIHYSVSLLQQLPPQVWVLITIFRGKNSRRHTSPIISKIPRQDRTTRRIPDYFIAACIAKVCILIRSCCLIFCFSPGERVVSFVFFFCEVGSVVVVVVLLMVECVEIGLFF